LLEFRVQIVDDVGRSGDGEGLAVGVDDAVEGVVVTRPVNSEIVAGDGDEDGYFKALAESVYMMMVMKLFNIWIKCR
jgi:hypothetical protein